MNIFLYIINFIMGTVFGSFYTLAIYRIPQRIDITHTHSFCPNCKHKLGFFELIPVWSYIFLGGKCKECKQKIRPRYLIIEICTGILFVLIALCAKIDFFNLNVKMLIELAFLVLYISGLIILAGIDFEKKQVEKSVIYYAIGIMLLYIIYLCIIKEVSIYRYVMYLTAVMILLIIDTIILKNKSKYGYLSSSLILLIIMIVFTGESVTLLSTIMTALCFLLYVLFYKIKDLKNGNKKEKNQEIKVSLIFFLCMSNILELIFTMFLINFK